MGQELEVANMETGQPYHGSLVAFEGPADVVSTQLRLLPPSPQVLVLPSLQHYMKAHDSTRFSARSYVKDVHRAARAQREVALQFLNEAGRDSKRLVFLNGGTAGAVSQCLSTISERQTSGDIHQAEMVFTEIACGGTNGLDAGWEEPGHKGLGISRSERGESQLLWEDDDEDPITKAMRAADALYRETESLQPIDCYIRTRPRSLSLPALGYLDNLGEASPFFVFGSPPNEESESNFDEDEEEAAIYQGPAKDDSNRASALRTLQDKGSRVSSFVDEAREARRAENRTITTMHFLSPKAEHSISPPVTPEGVVYGEARLVQMQASKTQKQLRTTRSLDDMDLILARGRRVSVQTAPTPQVASPTLDSPEAKSRHLSIVEDPYSSKNLLHLPQARFVKAQTTTIRRSPTFPKGSPDTARDSYVHQGTDPADFNDEMDVGFQPVLPFYEDLVVHFTSDSPDSLLDTVIQSFKDGSYPVEGSSPDAFRAAETDTCPSTPRTADLFDLEEDQAGLSPVAEASEADQASDYDPFAASGNDVRSTNFGLPTPNAPPPLELRRPPTPADTPVPGMGRMDAKFHDFSTAGRANAVATQNALRLVLENYFPPDHDGGYHQFNSTLLHKLYSLWRPIFGDSEATDGKSTEKTADLILAMGCQRGVKREFVSALTGQIEKLGSKSNGLSRSGRLDIRYLVANAMHSSSTHPLTTRATGSPCDNPYLLACLIVPHLETYLASNTNTRFLLLEYPAEHLATVLSLQTLVGQDVLKVAGIIDSEAASPVTSELPSPTLGVMYADTQPNPSQPRDVEPTLNTISLPGSPFPDPLEAQQPFFSQNRRLSFSKANYLLTSSATEVEIAALISAVWKVLIAADPFYTPEPAQKARLNNTSNTSNNGGGGKAVPSSLSLVSKYNMPNSPPLSPPSAADAEAEPTTPRSLQAGAASLAAAAAFPYAPPPMPLPAPPKSPAPRDDSPSRRSARGLRAQQQQQQQQQQQHHKASATAAAAPQQQPLPQGRVPRRVPGDTTDEDGASAYTVGGATAEEGEFYDDEERRLMPLYMRQGEMRKGNSRKALKWLGLA